MKLPLHLLAPALLGAAVSPIPPRSAPLPPIVFVSRRPPPDSDPDARSASARVGDPSGTRRGEIPGYGPHARALVVGGHLMIRDPNGAVRTLLREGALYDVSDPAVSWDGGTLAFAGTPAPDSAWRIYRVELDGSGLRALTTSDRRFLPADSVALPEMLARYDDLDPCWIGPRRLVFASTRWPLRSDYGSVPATNLYALDLDDPRPRRLTTERNGAEEPAWDPETGRIVFARWWHNRFRASDLEATGITTSAARALPADSANLWQLVSFDPARHDTRLAAGDPRSRVGTMAYQAVILDDGAIVASFARHLGLSPSAGGAGLEIFAGPTRPGRSGAAPPGARDLELPRALVAPRRLAGPALAAGPLDPYRDAAGLAAPQACSPAELPDGRIVFAFDPGARGDFGLYVIRPDGTALEPLVDLPGTLELDPAPVVPRTWREHRFDLDAAALDRTQPFRERPAPPGPGEVSFRFHCLNLFANAPLDAPIPDAPAPAQRLRVRFFAALARPESTFGDTVVLLRQAAVSPRGEIDVRGLPVDVPMFEQVVDARGHVLMSAHGPSHVAGFNASAPGERRCVGCHVGHSAMPVPSTLEAAREFNAAPAARVRFFRQVSRARPRAVVDRRVRGDGTAAVFEASDSSPPTIRLEWPAPLEIGAIVIHGLARLAVPERAEVQIELGGRIVERRTIEIAPGTGGVRWALPFPRADAIEMRLQPLSPPATRGSASSRPAAPRFVGVSEIEAIARLP